MLGEIDKDFYCAGSDGGKCCKCYPCKKDTKCNYSRYKHPTYSHFKEEYGEDVPDDMPVWVLISSGPITPYWTLMTYSDMKRNHVNPVFVIACTPFPKPDDGWRPEATK
jgi:hypothetical protein